MKFSYACTLLAGGFLSSGFHMMTNPSSSGIFFLIGVGSLIAAAFASGEGA